MFSFGERAGVVDPFIRDADESVDGVGVALNVSGEFLCSEVVCCAEFAVELFAEDIVGRGREGCRSDLNHGLPPVVIISLTLFSAPDFPSQSWGGEHIAFRKPGMEFKNSLRTEIII